jgi:hypothetical protein
LLYFYVLWRFSFKEPNKEQKEFSTLEDFSKIYFENPDIDAWAKIYMPKKDFKTIL